jgi:alpha-ketoglutarate-dependent taurine dioxygenase
MTLSVKSIKPNIGAVIEVDRARLLDEDVVAKCLELLEERVVVVFPRIGLTDAEQLAFTDRLGTRVNFTRGIRLSHDIDPDIYRVTLDPKLTAEPEYVQATFFWHMDGLTVDMPPAKASLLSARKIAAEGGQTEFASTYAAYQHLPESEKAALVGLVARHSVLANMRYITESPTADQIARWSPTTERPIVWTHASGRKSLVIGSTVERIINMPLPDGHALLARLLEWTAQPDFTYRHHWQVGDLVVWNNTGALHRVIPYSRDSGRTMHRTSVGGVEHVRA